MSTQQESNLPAHRSDAEQSKFELALRDLCEQKITFNAYLGFRVTQLNEQDVRFEFDMKPELVGHYLYGRLHGGVISAALDATGGMAVLWGLSEKYPAESADQIMARFAKLGTIDLRVDYLRPGIGELFVARAHVVRLGRRIATTQMALHNDADILVATATATYIVS